MRTSGLLACVLFAACVLAGIPDPPAQMADWSMSWDQGSPGTVSAADLLDRPAGRLGPVVCRDGHFYTGDRRIRFWGVNICFSGCFPTHEQADAVADRLAAFGVNCVRFHHMDMAPFPRGIFADNTLERLSPEALDRLDYFIAALKKRGIYANLNLHVSRWYSRARKWPAADQLPEFDKMVDLFHPELIAVQKQYARDLLTHVNAYTRVAYAAEPAVAMVEINNENTLFLWGGESNLEKLPEPYAAMFTGLWNKWLADKYGSRAKLAAAWNAGQTARGPNLLRDSAWAVERHSGQFAVTRLGDGTARLAVAEKPGQSWHHQYNHPGLRLEKGRTYSIRFTARAEQDAELDVTVSQAHEPWGNLGMAASVRVGREAREHRLAFTAASGDENARLVFSPGKQVGVVYLSRIELCEGGLIGLESGEDPGANTVARYVRGTAVTRARLRDWFDFLQSTDEKYFVDFRRFLKEELKVVAPITGTIGLGPLGTASQAKMDFVDGHSYWDHPHFPRRAWDMRDWEIHNRPMVDNPAGATLWQLAATRVAGLPYTVTEYNHAAPNEWQAECVPMIAAFAALQDWDGVFLFSYSHSDQFQKGRISSFFDIEGNPAKMPMMPLGARVFLSGGVRPLGPQRVASLDRVTMLENGSKYYDQIWRYVQDQHGAKWSDLLEGRFSVAYAKATAGSAEAVDRRVSWTGQGQPGTGRFVLADPGAAVFVGFASGTMPVQVGPLTIRKLDTPFAAIVLVPADPTRTLASADRLLLCAVARTENTGMNWDQRRRSVSDRWGSAPVRIEVVKGEFGLSLDRPFQVRALDAAGRPSGAVEVRDSVFTIGASPTVWYELNVSR